MKPQAPPQRWLSIEAAAAYAYLSRATIYRLIGRSLIASSRVGARRLVDIRSIDAYLEQCSTQRPIEPRPAPAGPAA